MRAVTKVVQPFASDDFAATKFSPLSKPLAVSSFENWTPRLVGLWLCGVAWMFAWWTLQWLRLSRTCRAARPAEGTFGQLRIPVLLAAGSAEAGVFGIFRPVLLLPSDIADRLSPAQLQLVIAHELVHVERHDNFWAALHAFVQALFWFHPMVWWMAGRLVADREKACDEAVLARGADAEEYAASILAVCRYYACAPQACVVGVAGADLRQRISAIMKSGNRVYGLYIRGCIAALALCTLVAPIILGRATALLQEPPTFTFEVASIHEWGRGQGPMGQYTAGVQFSKGRVHAQCASLQSLVFYAYDLTGSERLSGLPKWGNAACGADAAGTFTIDATMPANTTIGQSRQMMQALLAERFQFAAHWERRKMPAFEMTTVPGKLKLKPSDPGQDPPVMPGSIGCPADDTHCHIGFCCGSSTMNALAGILSHVLHKPVIDKTGLSGSYYFGVLRWAGDETSNSPLPSVFTLMREDFGLELKTGTEDVPVLIVDHVEKPAPN